MNIKEKLGKLFNRTSPEQLAEGIITSFNERKEKGEKDPIDNTVKEIMEIIKQNQNLEVTEKLLTKILEEKEISNKVAAETLKKISKDDEIPDKIITNAVQQASIQVPDELIEEIIKEGDVGPKERIKLIKNVEDKEILIRRVKNELKILYNNCNSNQDREIASRVQEIEEVLEKKDITDEVKDLVYQIVARKMAENYYDDNKKGTKIYDLSTIMSYEEMMENSLPEMVETEYQRLEEKGEEKPNRFSKTKLTQLILDKLAQDIVKKYKETGILAIPQLDNIKNITTEEERNFIRAIENSSEETLKKENIRDIHAQIRGNISNSQIKEDILIGKIKKISQSNKNRYIDLLTSITENTETLETLIMMQNSGLIEKLNSMPEEKREKTVETIQEVIGKRKVATQSIKMEGNPQVDIYQEL